MAKFSEEWKVFPHGPVERLADNLWRVQGDLPNIPIKRTMTVARRADGRLVVHSAIALDEPSMKEIEAWGKPSFLLVPNALHRLDAPAYKKRYPEIAVLAPRGSRRKIEQAVQVTGSYDEFPSDSQVELVRLPGVRDREGAMFVRSSDGLTIVLNDVVFNMDHKRSPVAFVITNLMGSAPGPRISRLAKALMVEDKRALRAELTRFADLSDLVRLVVSHEKVAEGSLAARDALRKAATFL
jgi:hypothetical protein